METDSSILAGKNLEMQGGMISLSLRLSSRLDTVFHQAAACCRAKNAGFPWRSTTHWVRSRLLGILAVRSLYWGGMQRKSTPVSVSRRFGIFLRMTARREKPADLSVGRSTKRALVIRPKTATVLGVTIPQPIFIVADRVIR